MAYFLSLACCLFSCWMFAKDLGTYGQTFDIRESHLLRMIREKGQKFSFEHFVKETSTLHPNFHPVKELQQVENYRKFYFDPTVCAEEDILDHEGKIVIARGQCANPLDFVSLTTELLFLDGGNKNQIAWAKAQKEDAYWILVSGNPLDVQEAEQRKVYFDQLGLLSKKLNLQHVPAKVMQNGKLLQVEEFPLEEKR